MTQIIGWATCGQWVGNEWAKGGQQAGHPLPTHCTILHTHCPPIAHPLPAHCQPIAHPLPIHFPLARQRWGSREGNGGAGSWQREGNEWFDAEDAFVDSVCDLLDARKDVCVSEGLSEDAAWIPVEAQKRAEKRLRDLWMESPAGRMRRELLRAQRKDA